VKPWYASAMILEPRNADDGSSTHTFSLLAPDGRHSSRQTFTNALNERALRQVRRMRWLTRLSKKSTRKM
jgi:hypothetical protein